MFCFKQRNFDQKNNKQQKHKQSNNMLTLQNKSGLIRSAKSSAWICKAFILKCRGFTCYPFHQPSFIFRWSWKLQRMMQLWWRHRTENNWFHHQSSGSFRLIQGPQNSLRPSWKVFYFPGTSWNSHWIPRSPYRTSSETHGSILKALWRSWTPQGVWGLVAGSRKTSRWRQTSGLTSADGFSSCPRDQTLDQVFWFGSDLVQVLVFIKLTFYILMNKSNKNS